LVGLLRLKEAERDWIVQVQFGLAGGGRQYRLLVVAFQAYDPIGLIEIVRIAFVAVVGPCLKGRDDRAAGAPFPCGHGCVF
jgi:hypothetical protein